VRATLAERLRRAGGADVRRGPLMGLIGSVQLPCGPAAALRHTHFGCRLLSTCGREPPRSAAAVRKRAVPRQLGSVGGSRRSAFAKTETCLPADVRGKAHDVGGGWAAACP
jgi:hypothetical protein